MAKNWKKKKEKIFHLTFNIQIMEKKIENKGAKLSADYRFEWMEGVCRFPEYLRALILTKIKQRQDVFKDMGHFLGVYKMADAKSTPS